MKKIYSVLLGATLLTAMPSYAADPTLMEYLDAHDGKLYGYSIHQLDYRWASLPGKPSGAEVIEKVSDTKIRIKNFLGRFESLEFDVNGNTICFPQGGSVVSIEDGLTYYIYNGQIEGPWSFSYNQAYSDPYGKWFNNVAYGGTWDGTFSWVNNKPRIQFDTMFVTTNINDYHNLNNKEILQLPQLAIFTPNGDASDDITLYQNNNGTSKHRAYKIGIGCNGDGTLQIVNFAMTGVALEASKVNGVYKFDSKVLTGAYTEDADYTRHITIQPVSIMQSYPDGSTRITKQYDQDGYADVFYSLSTSDLTLNVENQWLGKYVSSSNYKGSLTGTWSIDGAPHHVTEGNHAWTVNDGGKLVTMANSKIVIDPYVLWNDNVGQSYYDSSLNNSNGIIQKIENTEITGIARDLTHHATITSVNVDNEASDEYAVVTGNVAFAKNPAYVQNYELYMIPENINSLEGKEADFTHENGHVNGICLTEYEQAIPAALEEGDPSRNFELHIPYDKMKLNENGDNSKFEMTLYAKANYKPETGLAPTFHALTPVTVSIPTGVADLNSDYVRVSGGNGVIFANATVEVFNMAGQKIYEGNDSEIPAAAGVYLVRAAQKTFKVIVK